MAPSSFSSTEDVEPELADLLEPDDKAGDVGGDGGETGDIKISRDEGDGGCCSACGCIIEGRLYTAEGSSSGGGTNAGASASVL